jgi:hypothetical protein
MANIQGWLVVALIGGSSACEQARDLVEDLKDRGHGVVDGGAGGACGATDAGTAICSVPGCDAPVAELPGAFDLNDVWVAPGGEVWAVGEAGFVGRRAPETGAWCWCAPWPAATLRSVWGAPGGELFVVGDEGTTLRLAGGRWRTDPGSTYDLRAVYGTAANDVWAVGTRGAVRHFDGASWTSTTDETVDPKYDLRAVWIDPSGVVRAAGSAPFTSEYGDNVEAVVLRRPAEGAGAWIVEGSFPERGSAGFYGLSGNASTKIWAVGIDTPSGAAARYAFAARFDGTSWMRVPDPDEHYQNRLFTDVAVATPDGAAAWVADGRGGERYDGTAWTTSDAPISMTAIDARGAQMFAVGAYGRVIRWAAGAGWTVDHAGVVPPAAP